VSDQPEPMLVDDFLMIHQNVPALVCGCGTSVRESPGYWRRKLSGWSGIIIGVNDVARWVRDLDYLVLADPRDRFTPARRTDVEFGIESCETAFTAMGSDGWSNQQKFVDVNAAEFGFCRTSTSLAAGLAVWLGCNPIGVVGNDIAGHKVLEHPDHLEPMRDSWALMRSELDEAGVGLWSLSRGLIDTIPYMPVEEFIA
jgi:hypothetical protein